MRFVSAYMVRECSAVAVAAILGFGSGLLAIEAAGAAEMPGSDDGGAINGIVPVVDSAGNLRRDPKGNLMGVRVADLLPSSPSGASPSASKRGDAPVPVVAGETRTVHSDARPVHGGGTRTVVVEEVVTTATDPEASLSSRRLVSIPGTSRLGR